MYSLKIHSEKVVLGDNETVQTMAGTWKVRTMDQIIAAVSSTFELGAYDCLETQPSVYTLLNPGAISSMAIVEFEAPIALQVADGKRVRQLLTASCRSFERIP